MFFFFSFFLLSTDKQTLMGIFYYVHSVALIEDLPLEHMYKDPKKFYADADRAYSQVSVSFVWDDHNMIVVIFAPFLLTGPLRVFEGFHIDIK